MSGTRKTEHVRLQVADRDSAVEFYQDVLGLAEIDRDGGVVYLGCGFDENFDLAIQEGTPGIEHVAVRVESAAVLEEYETRLEAEGVSTRRTDGAEPNQEHGLRFSLPSDLSMEFVTVADKSYKHFYEMAVPGRGGLAPLDLDHHNFHSPDVERDGKFLRDVLDFKVSAIVGDWQDGAFLRRGDRHHDIAMFNYDNDSNEHASHHHTGFTVSSIDHMAQLIDRLVMYDVTLEMGISRHFGGDNIFAYFKAPDGHRIEFVTQMTELDDTTPPVHVDTVERAVSAWDDDLELPESWLSGSGLVREDQ